MRRKYSHRPGASMFMSKRFGSHVLRRIPLKRSLSGYEMEFCLIDGNGDVSNRSDEILAACRKMLKNFPIKKEVARNMVEVTSLPHSRIKKTGLGLMKSIGTLSDVCEKQGLMIMPLGTYPGTFREDMRESVRYAYSAAVLGRSKYEKYYPRCFGFHYHYTLPRGVFDRRAMFPKKPSFSRIKNTMIDSYNLLIAADPALTTFTQSSPFSGGKYYARDTRMLFWRGGKKLKFNGAFNNFQMLGGLPPYKQTLSDLISTLRRKDAKFRALLEKSGAPQSFIRNKKTLDFIWNPVKMNKIGTIEQRGMDMNHPEICIAVSVMLKFMLRAVQQDFYHVIPTDLGVDEPFKLEGNVILIPPQSHVRKRLQYLSAYEGLSNREMRSYCSRFYRTARRLVYEEYVPLLRPVKSMLDDGMTVSDKIVKYARKRGFSGSSHLPSEVSREIALSHSMRMNKRLDRLKSMLEESLI
ncbi:MAG: hypothetical protein JW789_01835 [Candidatus Aenigmarchaeota archaeon]|nr:hypothetical protein [Candidatus Aenigmarchaeota archaeon]